MGAQPCAPTGRFQTFLRQYAHLALLTVLISGCSHPGPDPGPDIRRDASPLPLELDAQAGLLAVPPLVGRPTASSATLQVVAGRQPIDLEVRVEAFADIQLRASLEAGESRDLVLEGLDPGTEYRYEILAHEQTRESQESYTGRFVTRRPPGSRFRFAVLSDTHLPVPAPEWLDPLNGELFLPELHDYLAARLDIGSVTRQVMASIREQEVDFILCLGDMLHFFRGFNDPFPSSAIADYGYLDLRAHLGQAGAEAAFFAAIGNWDGESGWQPEALRYHARQARLTFLPNPLPTGVDPADDTYLPGGSSNEDYFAWHWGDALLVVLNVMSYTPTKHTMQPDDNGTADDWTLGLEQLIWLETTLASSDARFKMIFIHHPVGGSGGDDENSAYGRGGGQAAKVGEQARVHALMRVHGVKTFFYGHDHVATDMIVDGIHYTLPGSAGAPWKFETAETGYEDYEEASGFALVDVSPERVTVELLDLEGHVFRRYDVANQRPSTPI